MNNDVTLSFEAQEAFDLLEKEIGEKLQDLEHVDIADLKEKQQMIRKLEDSIEEFYKMGMPQLTTSVQQEKEALENEIKEPLEAYECLQHYNRKLDYLSHLLKSQGFSPKITRSKEKRAARGEQTPQSEFHIYLLEALCDIGGKGRSRDVVELVGEKMKNLLTDIDKTMLPSGKDVRWKNRTKWARNDLVESGYLKQDSPQGWWEISQSGRQYYQTLKEKFSRDDR